MSFQRSILVAIATLITVGMTQVAFAGCCDWGGQAPVAYAQTGCGGCGAVAYAPVIYATPIEPQPIAVGCGGCGAPVTCCAPSVAAYAAPVGYGDYGGGYGGGYNGGYGGGYAGGYGGGYGGGCGNCGVPAVYTTPAPLYVVNQGPAFEGPGVMVPFHSYAPPAEYAPPPGYPPYAGGYAGGGYAGGGYAGGYAGGYHGGYGYPMHHYGHVAYGQGYPHAMGPHYYGGRPMMHRPYWRG
jgi:hypothetical protein